jgi:hypothetical protein
MRQGVRPIHGSLVRGERAGILHLSLDLDRRLFGKNWLSWWMSFGCPFSKAVMVMATSRALQN